MKNALLFVQVAAIGLLLHSATSAAPIVTASIDTTNQTSPGGYVASSTDLINAGSPTLASATPNVSGYFNFGGWTQLNNGSAGSPSVSGTMTDASTSSGNDAFITYTLQGSAGGYAITEFNSISGWPDQRSWQTIQLDVSTVSVPAFTPIGIINGNFNSNQAYRYTPAFGGAPGNASRLRFADSVNPGVTPIATGVTAIRVHILQLSPPSTEPGAYREWDLQGYAVPEPTSLGFLGLGAIALLRRRSRK